MQSLHGFLVGGHPAALASVGRSLSRSVSSASSSMIVSSSSSSSPLPLTVHPFFVSCPLSWWGVIVVVLFVLVQSKLRASFPPRFRPGHKIRRLPRAVAVLFLGDDLHVHDAFHFELARDRIDHFAPRCFFFVVVLFVEKNANAQRAVRFQRLHQRSIRYASFFPIIIIIVVIVGREILVGARAPSPQSRLDRLHRSRRQSRQSRQSPLVAQKISSSSSKRERGNTKRVSLLLERIIERLLLLWKDFIKSTDEENIQSRNREKEGRGREGLKESKSRCF